MSARRWLAAFAMFTVAAGVSAATDLADAGATYQRVTDAGNGAYRAVIAEYDRALRDRPRDVALAIARCEFLSYGVASEEGGPVPTDAASSCDDDLKVRFAAEPQVQIFLQGRSADDDAAASGDALLAQSQSWPSAQRCKLLDVVILQHQNDENVARVGELAVEAVRLCGDGARVAEAVRHLVGKKLAQPAATMLAEAPLPADGDEADDRLRAALVLTDSGLARREMTRYEAAGNTIDATLKARVLYRAGDVPGAAAVLPPAKAGRKSDSAQVSNLRFELALATGDARAAAAQVNLSALRSDSGKQLQRYVRVVAAEPSLALQKPLLAITGLLVISALVIMLMPGFIVVPVHYRGLVRRASGRSAIPLFPSVGLTRAWLALGLMLLVPLVVASLYAALTEQSMEAVEASLPGLFLGNAVLGLLLAPWAISLGREGWFGRLDLRTSAVTVLRCWGVLLAVMVLLAIVLVAVGGNVDTPQTRAVRTAITGGLENYGIAGTLLVFAVLVPLIEEFLFRGMLLGGLSRHLSFGASNFLQASLFAAVHMDMPRLPFYLALGLLAGWLVRRSGGLLPAVALHAGNNALAVLLNALLLS